MFYVSGFAMAPMPLVHPWILVLLTYTIGLLYSFVSCVENLESIQAKMIFYLSILGTGLFAYYQGRSASLNLTTAAFPAIIILTIIADKALSSTIKLNRVYDKVILCIILFIMIYSTASLAWNSPNISKMIIGRLRPTLSSAGTPVTQHSDFIKKNTNRGEEVLILSGLSGIYYLNSETTCPLKIPGPVELILVDDFQKINHYLEGEGDKKVILDANKYGMEHWSWLLKQGFKMTGSSPDGNISVFVK